MNPPSPVVVLRDVLASATVRLRAAGIEEARLEAEILLAHALGCARIDVLAGAAAARLDAPGARAAFERLLAGRERRVPVSYLIGSAEFYGRRFAVSPAVLVPRPETETLVELALQWARQGGVAAPRALDVGTGSGCLAVTFACERPSARVTATDVSRSALAVARANAVRHGVADRIRLVAADLFHAFRSGAGFDLALANPPYVSEPVLAACMPEVRDHEPRLATCGGPDGLAVIRRVLAGAPGVLAPGGVLLMEVAMGQAPAAAAFARDSGRYAEVRTVRDLAGIERVVVAASRQ